MENRMDEKVVFVTGASSGIGREIACRFASAGARLILTYKREKRGGEETKNCCLSAGAQDVLLLKLDVMSSTSITAAAEEVKRRYTDIHVLINNAGTGIVKPLQEQSFRDIEVQIRTNLEGLLKVTHAFLPWVRESIINIGSLLSKETMPGMAVYCATKFGVRGFTQALARELAHLRVWCVNPDMTATPLTGFQGRPPEAVADVVYRVVTGGITGDPGGDVDVWKVLS